MRPSKLPSDRSLARTRALLSVAQEPDHPGLLAALHERHASAPAVLYDRFSPAVQRTLVRILGADAEVADLLHEVFLRAIARVDLVVDDGALGPWLRRIAVFVAREHLRARRRRRWLRFFAPEDVPEVTIHDAPPELRQAVARLYRALDALSVDERLVFSLRHLEQMDLAEVAAACEVSLATVKRRLAGAEGRFAAISRRDPVLAPWLAGGVRWGGDR